jgi:Tfp pilus assembly protein PilP
MPLKLPNLSVIFLTGALASASAAAHMWQQDLERFPIARLSLYSIEIRSTGQTATILDPDGYLHTVKEGDWVGQTPEGHTSVYCVTRQRIYLEIVEIGSDGNYYAQALQWVPGQRPAPFSDSKWPKGCKQYKR